MGADTGEIRGRITRGSGDALAGVPVMIGGNSPAHVDMAAVTGPKGEYQLSGLVPGDYEILANPGDRLLVERVHVAGGEVAELHFVAEDQ